MVKQDTGVTGGHEVHLGCMFSPLGLYVYLQSRHIQGASAKADVWDTTDRWVRKAHQYIQFSQNQICPKSKKCNIIIQMYILVHCNPNVSYRHNDLPWQLRMQFNNHLNAVDLHTLNSTHTNIHKIKQGHLAAQVCEYSCTKVKNNKNFYSKCW